VLLFVRDRFTWLAYLMLAYFAYMQSAVGPLMPFLRQELHLSYTITGLHLSAFALGMVISGLTGEKVARRWGRRLMFWGGGAGLAVGANGLTLAHQAVFTIGSMLLMGWLGSLLLMTIQATLADRHQHLRAIALTESNFGASISSTMAPLLVGTLQRVGLGWQSALWVGVAALALLMLIFYRQPLPERPPAPQTAGRKAAPLPPRFWAYWLVLFLVVSVEWIMIFWGADFLENEVGLSKVNASTLMSVFFLAMVFGRFLGSRLTRRMAVERLVLAAVLVTMGGFPIFWLSPVAWLNITGLFITGLGIANLFPFTMSAAVGGAAEQIDAASARVSFAGGTSILAAPFAVGWIADQFGIGGAYGVVALFLVAALGVVLFANRLAARSA
jgi:fucose permease